MAPSAERRIEIESSDGIRLEGELHEAPGAAFGAVVLHPHPQFGGDMHNHVVMTVCDALAGRGACTLRFNFRGTGRSGGAYDGGAGEGDDARAALREMRAIVGAAPLLLAGYSFGAQVAARVAAGGEIAALVLISPPLGHGSIELPGHVPTLAVAGDADPVCPADELRALARPGVTVQVVPGTDHGWSRGLDALQSAIAAFDFMAR